jgi:predicted transcriptional regulator
LLPIWKIALFEESKVTRAVVENRPKRRDKLVIIAEIIFIARKGTSKTDIMFKANLSFSQLNQYLSILTQAGLLENVANDGRETYEATQKGLEFMEKLLQIINLINGFSKNYVKTSLEFDTNQRSKTLHITYRPFSRVLANVGK